MKTTGRPEGAAAAAAERRPRPSGSADTSGKRQPKKTSLWHSEGATFWLPLAARRELVAEQQQPVGPEEQPGPQQPSRQEQQRRMPQLGRRCICLKKCCASFCGQPVPPRPAAPSPLRRQV